MKYGILIVFSVLTLNSFSQKNCPKWITSYEQTSAGPGITIKSPQVAWLRNALMAIDRMIKSNASFSAIPEARFRNAMYASTKTAQLNAKAYIKRGWDDKCGLIPQADRIAADKAGITFAINITGLGYTATEYCPIHDDGLEAFYVPEQTGTIGGYPYYVKGDYNFILLTYNKKGPWLPVTLKEYLDYVERGINKRIAEHEKDKAKTKLINVNDADVKRRYEGLKKTSTKVAEDYLRTMEKLKRDQDELNNRVIKKQAEADADFKKELADFKAFQASLSTQELEKQAVTGSGKYDLFSREKPNNKRPLVKINPDFIADPKSKKIKIISISSALGEFSWDSYLKEAVETLDYKTLESLLK